MVTKAIKKGADVKKDIEEYDKALEDELKKLVGVGERDDMRTIISELKDMYDMQKLSEEDIDKLVASMKKKIEEHVQMPGEMDEPAG